MSEDFICGGDYIILTKKDTGADCDVAEIKCTNCCQFVHDATPASYPLDTECQYCESIVIGKRFLRKNSKLWKKFVKLWEKSESINKAASTNKSENG